jgi:uncharacterized protein
MENVANPSGGRQIIEGYGEGRFRVSGTVHRGSVLVYPDRTMAWNVSDMAELTRESLEPVGRAEPPVEVLLLGCGTSGLPVAAALRDALRADGVVIEAMATGAACRTFNVLMAEGRRVAAALIAVD